MEAWKTGEIADTAENGQLLVQAVALRALAEEDLVSAAPPESFGPED